MKLQPPKRTKQGIRHETQLTRPPRMESKVKEAMMQPVRKRSGVIKKVRTSPKPQGYSAKQRKDYQLKSKRR